MICFKCGTGNEEKSNFCKNCGQTLNADHIENNQYQTIFDNPYQSTAKSNTDLGYLLIALTVLINIFIWIVWGLFYGTLNENQFFYKVLRTLSLIFAIAQFVIMFIFTKRMAYRIVIAIIGLIVAAYDLYYFIQFIVDSRNF